MDEKKRRAGEYRKMKAAFEWNDWPVPTPQSFHHWTLARQVDHLVTAREDDPMLGFIGRLMTICAMPRTNPGRRTQFARQSGPYSLAMTAGYKNRLPYGNLPRLLLAWVCTEAVRTQRRELILGRSLSEFMRKVGIFHDSGAMRRRLREQMERLFRARIELVYERPDVTRYIASNVTDHGEFWWNPKRPDDPVLWDSKIRLGQELFNEIILRPVPLDLNILRALKRSALGLDLYAWLTYRTFGLKEETRVTWRSLYHQFGAHPNGSPSKHAVAAFRKKCLRELKKIKQGWSGFSYRLGRGVLFVGPAKPAIPPKGQ